jgi:hypothetical protein
MPTPLSGTKHMLQLTKSPAWEKLSKLFSRVVDSIGKEIDPGIIETVVGLNAAGIRTIASCEGHTGHGKTFPWIDITYHQKDKLEQEICQCLEKDINQDISPFLQRRDRLVFTEEQKVANLLNAFYQMHPMVYDRHLITIHLVQGEFRLQPYGGEAQKYRSKTERIEKLVEYQQEIQAFAEFLRGRFHER